VESTERYPHSLKSALQKETLENILDSNMFSAYIPKELPIPPINDPRKTQRPGVGTERYPGYVNFSRINQIFSYIGFVKRSDNQAYRPYLPLLFQELNLFIRVMEEIVYGLNVTIPREIYDELKKGTENFFASYQQHLGHQIEWIGKIWKNQKFYIERMDTLIDTLQARGRVFDYSADPLYAAVVASCQQQNGANAMPLPDDADIRFIANSCAKAARDNESKILWSGDQHIYRLLKSLYADKDLTAQFPQIYLHSSYEPLNHVRWFP